VDPTYFSIPDGLKFRGQHSLFKSWKKALTPPALRPPFGRTLLVRLVIIGTIEVVVPFLMLLLFKVVVLLAPVFNSVACISVVEVVVEISVILVSSSSAFL
jgi:hypothetical protein